jgi:hypothetical protein
LTDLVVADAGPLIGLARIESLWLLEKLYRSVVIPPAVRDELQVNAPRPGSRVLLSALQRGRLTIEAPPQSTELELLSEILDPGEAEAILLARERSARLLIDERRGREVARRRGVQVIGTGGVLLAAKRAGAIDRIAPLMDRLTLEGYRVGADLRNKVLELAGEM